MFWLATAPMLLCPMPPMPTLAMLSRSEGGVKPLPSTWRGTIARPAPVIAAVSMNCLREMPLSLSSMTPPLREGHDIPSGHDVHMCGDGVRPPGSTCRAGERGAVEVAVRRQEHGRVADLQDRPGAEDVRHARREGLLGDRE